MRAAFGSWLALASGAIALIFAFTLPSWADELPDLPRVGASWDELHAYEYSPNKLGLLLSVGVPHPLNLDLNARVSPQASVIFGGGYLPYSPSSGKVLSMSNIEAGARWHPFEGPFFAGALFGYQHFQFSTPVKLGPTTEDFHPEGVLSLNTIYLTPQVGFMWVFNSGILLGVDAGFQIPLYGWGGIKTSGYGPENASLAQSFEADSKRAATHFANMKFPELALIRVGWEFRK